MGRVVTLLMLTACFCGCRAYDATELMADVRTQNFAYPPEPMPQIDQIDIRVLRLFDAHDGAVADTGVPDAGVLDAGSPDAAAPVFDASVDASATASEPSGTDASASDDDRVPCGPDPTPPTGLVYTDDSLTRCYGYRLSSPRLPPITLGIVPNDGDESVGVVEIRATALLAGHPVVSARQIAGFAPHRRIYLPPIVLSPGCVGRVCPAGDTCSADQCVPVITIPACLVPGGEDAGPTSASCGADDAGLIYDFGADMPDMSPPTDMSVDMPADMPVDMPPPPVDMGSTGCGGCGGSTWRAVMSAPCASGPGCFEEQRRTCVSGCWSGWTWSGACITTARDPC